jgi:hypothetical protein
VTHPDPRRARITRARRPTAARPGTLRAPLARGATVS